MKPKTYWNSTIKIKPKKKVKRKKRIKLKSIKSLKKKAWKLCSIYVRTRDCLETTGTKTRGRCFTCDKIFDFKDLQAGHFIQGRHNAVLFDTTGIHAQCKYCNIILKGNLIEYYPKMQEIYGDDIIEALKEKNKKIKQFKRYELEEWIKVFKNSIKEYEYNI